MKSNTHSILLLLLSFGSLLSLSAQEKAIRTSTKAENNVEIPRWFNGAATAVALTFDDGFRAHYSYAYPLLEKYGVKGTFFVNSGYLVNRGQSRIGGCGFWQDFAEMAAAGHEIGSHTITHPNLTSLSAANLHKELADDKAMIESKIPNQKCITIAYPSSLFNQTVIDTVAHYFIAARQGGLAANDYSLSEINWLKLWSGSLTWGTSRTLEKEQAFATKTKNEILNQLIPTGKFGVYCIHEVLPFNMLNTTTSWEPCTTEWLEEICKFLDEKHQTNDVWPTTLANIARYSRMRDKLNATNVYTTTDSIAYTFTDGLDDLLFNIPITVIITVPVDFTNVIIFKNNQPIDTVSVVNQRIKISVIPDKEVVTIRKNSPQLIESRTLTAFNCYPNPFNHEVLVEVDHFIENASICLNDMSGRLIQENQMNLSTSNANKIKFGNLPKGQYILSLFDGKKKIAFQKICN